MQYVKYNKLEHTLHVKCQLLHVSPKDQYMVYVGLTIFVVIKNPENGILVPKHVRFDT